MPKEQIIIAVSGRKSAGKNTIAKYIRQYAIEQVGIPESEVLECSFADSLKDFCIETLGIEHNQCYGTEDEKNSPTSFMWEDVPDFYRWKFGNDFLAKELVAAGYSTNRLMAIFYKRDESTPAIGFHLSDGRIVSGPATNLLKTGPMTGRDIMQIFGTDLIRNVFGNVWAASTIRRIKRIGKTLSLITDNRFPNEVQAVLEQPLGYVIRLTRSPFGIIDAHPSESALDLFDWKRPKCYILDNDRMTLQEQNDALVPTLELIF